jgi:hypothetical protein
MKGPSSAVYRPLSALKCFKPQSDYAALSLVVFPPWLRDLLREQSEASKANSGTAEKASSDTPVSSGSRSE